MLAEAAKARTASLELERQRLALEEKREARAAKREERTAEEHSMLMHMLKDIMQERKGRTVTLPPDDGELD